MFNEILIKINISFTKLVAIKSSRNLRASWKTNSNIDRLQVRNNIEIRNKRQVMWACAIIMNSYSY